MLGGDTDRSEVNYGKSAFNLSEYARRLCLGETEMKITLRKIIWIELSKNVKGVCIQDNLVTKKSMKSPNVVSVLRN